MNRNAVLCFLMGAAAPLPFATLQSVWTEPDGALLFAFYCARVEDVDAFAGAVDGLEPGEIRLLSSYCLMLGLSGRVQGAFMLFDILKWYARQVPGVWLDLACLQSAWGYLLPALRSETMYRKLSGGHVDMVPAPLIVTKRSDPGPIHIMDGDLPSVRRV